MKKEQIESYEEALSIYEKYYSKAMFNAEYYKQKLELIKTMITETEKKYEGNRAIFIDLLDEILEVIG